MAARTRMGYFVFMSKASFPSYPMTIDMSDPIFHNPIRTRSVLSMMEAIRDYHLDLRDEGNTIWKEQVEAENPDVDLMIELKGRLENHGLVAALISRRIAEYHGKRYEARHHSS